MQHKFVDTGDGVALDSGYIEALVASFDTVDRGGDLIRPGAFHNSLKRWQSSGRRIPIVWSHMSGDPAMVIGGIDPDKARETDDGLVIQGQLDLTSSAAREALRLLKSGDVGGWSFGYKVPPDGERQRDGYREIFEIDLLEVGPTPVPMNDATRTLAAKSEDGFRRALVEAFSDKEWDGSPSRFSDEEYAASCILDRADCSAEWKDRPVKERYSLPIKDPGGGFNPDALGPAAAALAGARGGVKACPEAIAKAQRRLLVAYRLLDMEPPESFRAKRVLAEVKAASALKVASFEC
jgi:uncharacterized protein